MARTAAVSIVDVLTDPELLGRWFAKASQRAWVACAAAIFGVRRSPNLRREKCSASAALAVVPGQLRRREKGISLLGGAAGRATSQEQSRSTWHVSGFTGWHLESAAF